MNKNKVFTDFNASTLANVLLFIKKAENFRIERSKLRREMVRKKEVFKK